MSSEICEEKIHKIEFRSKFSSHICMPFEIHLEFRSLTSSSSQREESTHADIQQSEKRPLVFSERLRVSAVPQMTDISENVILEKNNVICDSHSQTSSNFSQVII